jgi:hypothetical protein
MRVRGSDSLQVVEIPGTTDLLVVVKYEGFRSDLAEPVPGHGRR